METSRPCRWRADREIEMRAILKEILYALGFAWLLNFVRNRAVLTVVMFHRVLPAEDLRSSGAGPSYTVTPREFELCLNFFHRYYNLVSLDEVYEAALGKPLPRCPLLLTFDDGWADTAEFAAPYLRARRLPAVLFVATGFIGDEHGFWQERIVDSVMSQGDGGMAAAKARIRDLALLPRRERERQLSRLRERALPRRMCNAEELCDVQKLGVAIGGHGTSHEPLTEVEDADQELRSCRETLRSLGLGGDRPSMSFPHGKFDESLVDWARSAGFGLCFTSVPPLTPVSELPRSRTIGRISMELAAVRRASGLDAAGLAFSLITRPHAGWSW